MVAALEVLWEGQRVGRIVGAEIELFHLVGRWEPAASSHAAAFAEALEEAGSEGVGVALGEGGHIAGRILDPPGEVVDVVLTPR